MMKFVQKKCRNKGYTIIELTIIILILAILATAGIGFFDNFLKLSIFLPSQVRANLVATEALQIMIEGDDKFAGLKGMLAFDTIDSDNNGFEFINKDGVKIRYHFDGTKLDRSYYDVFSFTGHEVLPYFQQEENWISAPSNKMFTFYNSSMVEILPGGLTQSIAFVDISIIVKPQIASVNSYSDGIDSWRGYVTRFSGVAINKF